MSARSIFLGCLAAVALLAATASPAAAKPGGPAPSPLCPAGSVYNNTLKRCEAPAIVTCATGLTLNGTVCASTPTPTCPAGATLDSGYCTGSVATPVCSRGSFQYYGNSPPVATCFICTSGCTPEDFTPPSGAFIPEALSWTCDEPWIYSTVRTRCEQLPAPTCPVGVLSATTSRCEAASTLTCRTGFVLDATPVCYAAPLKGPRK